MTRTRKPPAVVHLIAFLWGLQFAFLNPALALLLVSTFGASTGQVAVVLVIYNSSCLVTSFLVPRWADRHGQYLLPMLGCAGFTVALALALSLVHALSLAVAGLVLLGAPAAVGTPLLFGFVRHSGATPRQVVRIRAMFSTSWVAGPPLAALIISVAGGHALVLGVGAVGLLNIVAIGGLHRRHVPLAPDALDDASAERRVLVPRETIALVVLCFALLQAANSTSVSMVSLFATKDLHLAPIWGGAALGVAAGLEVPALLFLGRRNRRFSDVTALTVACLLGVAYYLTMSTVTGGVPLVLAQVLNASFYGVVAGVGLTLFQSIIAGPGAAAGLLSNAQRLGGLFTGLIVGLGSLLPGGLRAVYVLCALVTCVGFVLVRRIRRRLVAAALMPPHVTAVDSIPRELEGCSADLRAR